MGMMNVFTVNIFSSALKKEFMLAERKG